MSTPTETRQTRPNFWLRAIEHRKHALTREYRRTLGATAREGISDEDYATTMATLEKMARNLGWSEDQRDDQRHDRRFGPGFGRGHGRPGHHGHPGRFDRFDRREERGSGERTDTATPES